MSRRIQKSTPSRRSSEPDQLSHSEALVDETLNSSLSIVPSQTTLQLSAMNLAEAIAAATSPFTPSQQPGGVQEGEGSSSATPSNASSTNLLSMLRRNQTIPSLPFPALTTPLAIEGGPSSSNPMNSEISYLQEYQPELVLYEFPKAADVLTDPIEIETMSKVPIASVLLMKPNDLYHGGPKQVSINDGFRTLDVYEQLQLRVCSTRFCLLPQPKDLVHVFKLLGYYGLQHKADPEEYANEDVKQTYLCLNEAGLDSMVQTALKLGLPEDCYSTVEALEGLTLEIVQEKYKALERCCADLTIFLKVIDCARLMVLERLGTLPPVMLDCPVISKYVNSIARGVRSISGCRVSISPLAVPVTFFDNLPDRGMQIDHRVAEGLVEEDSRHLNQPPLNEGLEQVDENNEPIITVSRTESSVVPVDEIFGLISSIMPNPTGDITIEESLPSPTGETRESEALPAWNPPALPTTFVFGQHSVRPDPTLLSEGNPSRNQIVRDTTEFRNNVFDLKEIQRGVENLGAVQVEMITNLDTVGAQIHGLSAWKKDIEGAVQVMDNKLNNIGLQLEIIFNTLNQLDLDRRRANSSSLFTPAPVSTAIVQTSSASITQVSLPDVISQLENFSATETNIDKLFEDLKNVAEGTACKDFLTGKVAASLKVGLFRKQVLKKLQG